MLTERQIWAEPRIRSVPIDGYLIPLQPKNYAQLHTLSHADPQTQSLSSPSLDAGRWKLEPSLFYLSITKKKKKLLIKCSRENNVSRVCIFGAAFCKFQYNHEPSLPLIMHIEYSILLLLLLISINWSSFSLSARSLLSKSHINITMCGCINW